MSSRKPRFDADDFDDDPKLAPRSRRPPTPDDNDHVDLRPAGHSKKKSILVDPNEDPRDRQQRRSNSRVRVKPPPSDHNSSDDEGTIKGSYVRHRNGEVEFVPDGGPRDRAPKRRTHDLEKKTGDGERRFRERRNGYESDEGESLRAAKKGGPKVSRGSIGDVDDVTLVEKPKGRSPYDSQYVKPRAGHSNENAFVVPDRSRRHEESGRNDDIAAVGRRRELAHKRYDSDEEDVAPRRRPPQRRPTDRHDRGYDSEGPSRRRNDWDNDDRYDKRRSARYDDDPAPRRRDARDDRKRSQPRSSRYDDDYDRSARSRRDDAPIRRARSDAKPRDRDRYGDRRGGGSGRDADKKKVWMDQAGTLFMTHALPVLKSEGPKWAKKGFETYMSAQRR